MGEREEEEEREEMGERGGGEGRGGTKIGVGDSAVGGRTGDGEQKKEGKRVQAMKRYIIR